MKQTDKHSNKRTAPKGMGPGNAGHRPSPAEDFSMKAALKGTPSVTQSVMPGMPAKGLLQGGFRAAEELNNPASQKYMAEQFAKNRSVAERVLGDRLRQTVQTNPIRTITEGISSRAPTGVEMMPGDPGSEFHAVLTALLKKVRP